MPWLIASALIQIACAIHVIRNGRNQTWIMVIMFLPLAGAAAYFILEILPGLRGNRHVRTAHARAVAHFDPERDLRAAQEALSLADTVANRIAMADALAGLDRHEEAISYYREALARSPGGDDRVKAKLARALIEIGEAAEAERLVDEIAQPSGIGEQDRLAMLRARILEAQGKIAPAMAIYADLVSRYPGEEARCRYAALLLQAGDRRRARGVLEEVEQRMKRLDRTQRAAEADMYDWAMEQLRSLRADASA
ncbi:MAG: tetratricopeptide repeat protein [Sphingobium sp.]